MAFPARANQGSNDAAKDAIPVTASSTNNVFGNAYNSAQKTGDNRACKGLLADAALTLTIVTATGQTRTGVVIQPGVTPLQVIQVTSISGGNLWALI